MSCRRTCAAWSLWNEKIKPRIRIKDDHNPILNGLTKKLEVPGLQRAFGILLQIYTNNRLLEENVKEEMKKKH